MPTGKGGKGSSGRTTTTQGVYRPTGGGEIESYRYQKPRPTKRTAAKNRVGEVSLAQAKKLQANQKRKQANKMGAEGPKRSAPRRKK